MADELLVIGEEAFDTETNQPVWWDGEGWSYVKPRAPLTPQIRPANMPLSYAQQRLWFLDQLGGGASAEYNMPEAMRLRGELDLHALTRAINTIVARHESLRTHFAIVDGEPVQIIEPALRIDVPVHDLRSFGEASRHEAIDAALRREWQQPFDLQRGPLLRVKVLELGERDRILLWTSHHIVSDGWSIGVISHELVALYEAFAEGRENPLEPLSIQYADFALWQRAWMEDGGLEEGLRYWKEQLRGIPERLELPADHPRPATQTFAADAVHASLSSEELAPVMRMTQAGGATLFMTLLTTFAVLLERYSGQADIVIGSPIANRRETQLERLIGFFVNSLVMRVRVRTDLTFRELLAEVRQTTLDAYQHQDVPFERLVEELSPERNLSATPLFQVAFVLQNAPGGSARLRDLEIERVSSDELRVRFDMEIHAVESDGALTLAWVYNRDLFERWRIEQMARHFVRLLADATARPDAPLHRLRMQEQRERYTLLEELNATSRAVPPQTFPRIFEEQVARTPDAIAIVSGDESLTYAQLNERANRLAHHLIERGVGPERIVGISMLKSIDQWIAVLATMKAGGAYLPLDPDYPEERIQMMLADAKPVLVERRRPAGWPGAVPAPPPETAGETPALHEYPSHNPTVALSLAHPAYIIYTSGSTGVPKGVVVTHAGIASLRAAQSERFAIDANARVLQFASLNFDASFAELAVTLGSGAALILPREDERSGSLLRDLIARQRITHATLPPTVLATFDEHDELALETLIVAGEPCPPDQVGRWSQGRRFINAYGPTETTVCATMSAPLSGAQTPPIGAPNLNTRVYVLDAAL
ncbi:MAG TPA: condensation domain-containing protein, partial [Thermoanaerobaculia bacterium]